MVFVFTGYALARDKARVFIDGLLKKKPDATLVRLSGDSWQSDELRGLAQAQSLFSGNSLVRLDGFFTTRESAEQLEPLLPSLAESSNVFVFVEDKLHVADKKILEKHVKEIKEYKDKELQPTIYNIQSSKFNIYALADALADRKRRELWFLYHEALSADIPPEEIYWKFVWQVRHLLLAKTSGKEGLIVMKVSPYPAQKALRSATGWQEGELLSLSERLVVLYHDFEKFRGDPDLEFALERVILSL